MKFKLKRIDWYIIMQFLGTYIFAIALIIAISVVFDINAVSYTHLRAHET